MEDETFDDALRHTSLHLLSYEVFGIDFHQDISGAKLRTKLSEIFNSRKHDFSNQFQRKLPRSVLRVRWTTWQRFIEISWTDFLKFLIYIISYMKNFE